MTGSDSHRGMTQLLGLVLLCVGLLLPMVSFTSEEGHERRHHVAVFVGATHAEGEDELTVGADYEYRLTPEVGVGAPLDHGGGDLDAEMVTDVPFFHPREDWMLLATAGGQNKDHQNEATAGTGEAGSEGAHGGEAHHAKHTLAVFVGITREHSENLETLGIEYAYRINRLWSIGAVIERAEREKDSTLASAFVRLWPYKGLFLGAGVGRKDPGGERENTFRATIGYDFELGGGWVIAPQANLDVIEGEENEEVYGIAFGKQF